MRILSIIFAGLLAGCVGIAEKPNNTAAFTSDQIFNLALQVERAQATGSISETDGDRYLVMLLRANNMLADASSSYNDIPACHHSETRFQCIDAILAEIERAL